MELFECAIAPNVAKLLTEYINRRSVPRNIRLDQARCLLGNKTIIKCQYIEKEPYICQYMEIKLKILVNTTA